MKDGLTQVKELKDKIHEQYIEIQELNKRVEDLKTINEEHQILNGMLRKEIDRLNKARKFDIEYNKYLQKEIIRLNNIIKRLEEDLREMYLTFGEFSEEYTENVLKKLEGENNE